MKYTQDEVIDDGWMEEVERRATADLGDKSSKIEF